MTERDELLLSMMIQDAYNRPVNALETLAPETLIRGDIKHFHFPDLLLYLRRIQATGVLYISRERIRKKVYISAGIPTAAQSNLKHELLGEFLVSRGAITADQQQQALTLHVEKKINFAAAAMELGAIGRTDLFNLARQHFLTILYSLFGLKSGTYRFDEQELPQVLFCYQVSFSRMLVFGLRLIADREVLLDMLGDLNKVAVPTDRFSEYGQIMFTDKEVSTIHQIDSKRTLKEIIESSRTPSLTAMKTLLVLLYHGLIRFEVELDGQAQEELVDLEERDAQLLGFQSYEPGRLDEEEAVAGEDFLIPPHGIPAGKDKADQATGGAESQGIRAANSSTELARESVLRVDRLFSDRSTWIDTLLWGVVPVAPQGESRKETDHGPPVENDLASKSWAPLLDSIEPESSETSSSLPMEQPPLELNKTDDTAPMADRVSSDSLDETNVMGDAAADESQQAGEARERGEESPILDLTDSIDEAEERDETIGPIEPLPSEPPSPISIEDDETPLLTRTAAAGETDLHGAETRIPYEPSEDIFNLKKPLYWTALLFILCFAIYSLSPWGRETPEPVPEGKPEAVYPVAPEAVSLTEPVQKEEEAPGPVDDSKSGSSPRDVFSGSPETRLAEENVIPPTEAAAPNHKAPAREGEPAGQSQTIAPEASTDAPPGQTELSNQGLEITPGPGTRKRPVPPLLAVEEFRLLVNGQPTRVPAGAALVVSPGDTLVIEGVIPTPTIDGHVKINFVGFVGNKSFNDADDRGYVIQTGNLMKRHALDAQGTIYRIEATAGKARVAEIFIRVRR